jgi:PAS domain S-box-containing protein
MIKQHIILEILKTIPGTLNVVDTDYNILAVGGEIARTFEKTEQIIGKKCYRVFQKRQNPCPWCKLDKVIKTGAIINETTTPDDPREKLVKEALNIYIRPLKDRDGNIIGALELGTDITQIREANEELKRAEKALQRVHDELERRVEERTAKLAKTNEQLKLEIEKRKQTEEALRESEEKARALLNTPTDVIALIDSRGIVFDLNEAMAERLGKAAQKVIRSNIYELFSPDVAEFRKSKVDEVMRSGKPIRFSEEAQGICFDTAVYPVFDSHGEVTKAAVFARDVTELKRAEEALQRAHEELERRVEERTAELSKANTELLDEITVRKHAENALEIQANELAEVNSALRVLLKQRQDDRAELEEKVLFNVKDQVAPYLEKMKKSGLNATQMTYLTIIESNLDDIISPFSRRLSYKYLNLTSAEIQVANLIKQGKTTKEIAEFLNLSTRTIESHRKNIRRKTGIKNRKESLRTRLLAIQ